MRQGSKIRELDLTIEDVCVDIPKFTNYGHGITYLRCLNAGDLFVEFQNTIDFLIMVPRFCNSITKSFRRDNRPGFEYNQITAFTEYNIACWCL